MPVVYETSRLFLRRLQKDSADLVLNFYEKNKTIFEPWEPKRADNFYTLPYQKASLSAEHYQMAEGKLLRFWVFLKDHPEEIIGSFCFQNFLRAPYQSCSLGYKFDQRFHHQGFAYESILKGIEILFDTYPIHRIEAYIMPSNLPSIRLIERLDFHYEGLSSSFANINGQWSDHKRFAFINY